MKHLNIYACTLLVVGLLFAMSCTKDTPAPVVTPDPTPDTTTTKVTYTADVAPIFNASCANAGCHNSGSGVGSLANYTDAKAYTQTGKVLKAIKHQSGAKPMPQGGSKLPDATIAKVEQWIADGYLEN